MKARLGIFRGFNPKDEGHYRDACRRLGIASETVDILGPNWMAEVRRSPCDGFLVRPPDSIPEWKTIFDERLYFITKVLGKKIYPSYEEILLYGNKRVMTYWLQAHGYPHPKTRIFARRQDAREYIRQAEFPMVFKASAGASSSGVDIIYSARAAEKVINRIFGRFHPMLAVGYLRYKKKYGLPIPRLGAMQRHYLIVQDYKNIKWEWRIIKIDNSYFGHRKLLSGGFASGSDRVGWVAPPEDILRLAKEVCETGKFYSMALDIFETCDDEYLINEMQSLFGSYNKSQMYINGIPGRYVYRDGSFHFERGYFNQCGSCLLRVKHFLKILDGTAGEEAKGNACTGEG